MAPALRCHIFQQKNSGALNGFDCDEVVMEPELAPKRQAERHKNPLHLFYFGLNKLFICSASLMWSLSKFYLAESKSLGESRKFRGWRNSEGGEEGRREAFPLHRYLILIYSFLEDSFLLNSVVLRGVCK